MNRIPHNIAKLLKQIQQETGKSLMEFSEDFDIPHSTLQNLLRGEKALRTDTVEMLADKFNVPIADLVSGEPAGTRITVQSALVFLLRRSRAMPEPFQSAATALLRSFEEVFRLSELVDSDADLGFPSYCSEEDTYRYFVHESEFGCRYGLIAKQKLGHWTTVEVAPGLSDDLGFVFALARYCTIHQLPPKKCMDDVCQLILQISR